MLISGWFPNPVKKKSALNHAVYTLLAASLFWATVLIDCMPILGH